MEHTVMCFLKKKKKNYYTLNLLFYLKITLPSSIQGRLPYRPKHAQRACLVKEMHLLEQQAPTQMGWCLQERLRPVHAALGAESHKVDSSPVTWFSHPEGCSLSEFQLSTRMCWL